MNGLVKRLDWFWLDISTGSERTRSNVWLRIIKHIMSIDNKIN